MANFWTRIMQVVVLAIIVFVVLWILGLFLALPAMIVTLIKVLAVLYAVGILFGWVAGPSLPF